VAFFFTSFFALVVLDADAFFVATFLTAFTGTTFLSAFFFADAFFGRFAVMVA
jgi:hypothetical protein